MRALQIVFLISFAIFALVFPYVIFSFVQGQSDNSYLIILPVIIFALNAFFIIRKVINLKKNERSQP